MLSIYYLRKCKVDIIKKLMSFLFLSFVFMNDSFCNEIFICICSKNLNNYVWMF